MNYKSKLTLLILLALSAVVPAFGTPIESEGCLLDASCFSYGLGGASVTLQSGDVLHLGSWESWSDVTTQRGSLDGGVANIFGWSVTFDVDPFFNWSFTSLIPGNYVVNFMIPVIDGPYNFLAHSAGGSITGVPGTTSIQNYTAKVEIPNGVPFGAGAFDLALADTTAPTPFTVNIPVGSKQGAIAPISPASMGVTVSWTHVGTGAINLNGGLVLIDNSVVVPEPETFALAGIALLGLGLLRLRRA